MIVLCHEFCAPLEVAVNLYQRVLSKWNNFSFNLFLIFCGLVTSDLSCRNNPGLGRVSWFYDLVSYILDVIFKLRWICLGADNMIKDLLLFSCFYFKSHCIDYSKTGLSNWTIIASLKSININSLRTSTSGEKVILLMSSTG